MRWMLVAALVVSGCATDTADVPATVVHIDVQTQCADCYPGIVSDCGDYIDPIGSTTRHVEAATSLDPDQISGLVQLQYTGAVAAFDPNAHLDAILPGQDRTDVFGVYDSGYDAAVLYRIDGAGSVTDIDTTRLVSASGSTLHFAYSAEKSPVTEDHVIDPPRVVNIETTDPGPCCSVGEPQELGIGLVLLVTLRRRRRSKLPT